MSLAHFNDYDSIEAAMLGFSKLCRENGIGVGLNHTFEALQAARSGFINDPSALKYGLRALFCTSEDDHANFNRLFDIYWRKKRHEYMPRTRTRKQTRILKESQGSLVMMGMGNLEESEKEDAGNVTGANKMESLRKTDFSKVADIDQELLDRLADKLMEQLNYRIRRRLKAARTGKIDIRKTIRGNLSSGDTLIQLLRKNRKFQKYRLVILLDVSGSMDKYSFYLLKFIWALKSNFKDIEAFVFSTKLLRITDIMDQKSLEQAMYTLGESADHWSSGTTIGKCLKNFNEQYSKRILNGRSISIILSDGLETGDPTLLKDELKKIRLRTSKVIWLNPLKGMSGYQPIAKGMAAALPEIHTFESAHNLDSLMELEKHLSHV